MKVLVSRMAYLLEKTGQGIPEIDWDQWVHVAVTINSLMFTPTRLPQ